MNNEMKKENILINNNEIGTTWLKYWVKYGIKTNYIE